MKPLPHPDSAGLDLSAGLLQQGAELLAWHGVLQPEAFRELLTEVTRSNSLMKVKEAQPTRLDVLRGDQITHLVSSIARRRHEREQSELRQEYHGY